MQKPPGFEGWRTKCPNCSEYSTPQPIVETDPESGTDYCDYVCPLCAFIILTIDPIN